MLTATIEYKNGDKYWVNIPADCMDEVLAAALDSLKCTYGKEGQE